MNLNGDKGCTCRDCDKRELGCHSTCQEYIEYKKRTEEYKNKRDSSRNDEFVYINYKMDTIIKRERKMS